MSADPRRVPEAQVIDELTYNEAMELAYFGAEVIHPQTLGPVVDNSIPVIIRSIAITRRTRAVASKSARRWPTVSRE